MAGEQQQQEEPRTRPSAENIYENVKRDAAEELARPPLALAFSGLFAGGTVGFSGLAAAAALAVSHHAPNLIGAIFYPIGFIAVIIGRAQLFTENTLYPVTLVLDERRGLVVTLRLWMIVYATNVLGAFLFALLVTQSNGLPGAVVSELAHLGQRVSTGAWSGFFWSGLLAGWLLALVAWLVEASTTSLGRIAVIWAATFVIAAAGLSHCVSTTVEVLSGVLDGRLTVAHFFAWLGPVTLGNIVGGVVIVAVLNYGQVRAGTER